MIVHAVKAFAYWKAETGYGEVTCAGLGAPGCVKHSLILPVKKTCFSFSKFGITFTANKNNKIHKVKDGHCCFT